jgi:hypothetical protein
MLAFPRMLVEPAKKAGIRVPEDVDKDYDKQKFPHWHVFCTVQLGATMPYPSVHWRNAEVIAKIPEDKIRILTLSDLQELGVE